MLPPPAVQLVPASFHVSWSLWLQAPLVLLVVACTARPVAHALSGIAWSRTALVLVVAAPLAVAWLMPQREYHFAGHEGAYGELLDGRLPESGDLTGHRTFAVPAGLAWAMGRVAPGHPARGAWLVGNRASLALVLLCLGAVAGRLVSGAREKESDDGADRRQRIATLVAILGGLAAVPVAGWSATALFIAPALALGLVALLLGLAREPVAAVAIGRT